jgi:cytochrome c biogenesis protein CcmG, thiol:disulfide interchange protein DsbE
VSRVRGGPVWARWLAPPLALLLAACTATETPAPSAAQDAASPFTDCSTLTAAPPPAGSPAASGPPVGAGAAGGGRPAELPELSLPCFTGGAAVSLTALRGPAVINLWGSWCGPCRDELPVIQALADATAGRLRVIGVDTRDSRDAGASFAADRGVSMPTLFDPDLRLLTALGKVNLPVTVFLNDAGERFVYTGKALDKPTLGALVRTHAGVTVTG